MRQPLTTRAWLNRSYVIRVEVWRCECTVATQLLRIHYLLNITDLPLAHFPLPTYELPIVYDLLTTLLLATHDAVATSSSYYYVLLIATTYYHILRLTRTLDCLLLCTYPYLYTLLNVADSSTGSLLLLTTT